MGFQAKEKTNKSDDDVDDVDDADDIFAKKDSPELRLFFF